MLRFRKLHITEEDVLFSLFMMTSLCGMYLGTKVAFFQVTQEKMNYYFYFATVGQWCRSNSFLLLIATKRMGEMLLLLILPIVKRARCWLRSLCTLVGSWFGIILANMIRTFGMRGILLFLLAMFPQTICYVLCALELYHFSKRSSPFLESYVIMKNHKGPIENKKQGKALKQLFVGKSSRLFYKIILLGGFGILAESYLNPYIMEWMFRD